MKALNAIPLDILTWGNHEADSKLYENEALVDFYQRKSWTL